MNNYDYTDKLLKTARRLVVRSFDNYKISKKDLSETRKLYGIIKEFVQKMYLKIVRHYYVKYGGKKKKKFDDEWLYEFLMEFDPMTGYQFSREWDRKLYRQYESVEACKKNKLSPSKPIDRSMSLLNSQITQKAIKATDTGVLEALKEQGVKKVRWITRDDEKVCDECWPRHMQVFDINKVPPKHPNCRCWLVREDENRTRQGSL